MTISVISVQYKATFLHDIVLDPMGLSSGDPTESHVDFLHCQPKSPTKPYDAIIFHRGMLGRRGVQSKQNQSNLSGRY